MLKHLENGQAFPDLAVPAIGGGTLSLPADLAGSYGVILIYRGHWCPFCNEQLAAFAGASEALSQEGIRVLAFSVEDEPTTREVIAKNRVRFKMGHSAEVEPVVGATGAYETRHKTRGHYLENTGFVLAPNGTVVTAVYSSRAIGRLVPNDVIRLVAFLKSLA
jgi:peroxiredoxin